MTQSLPNYPNIYQQNVAEFHRIYGLPDLIETPTTKIPKDRCELRASLINEEGSEELSVALSDQDPVAIVDALIDLAYVTYGALVEMGYQATPFPLETLENGSDADMITNSKKIITLAEYASNRILKNTETPKQLAVLAMFALQAIATGGYDVNALFNEVQRSNMSKLGTDGQPIRSRGMELDGAPEGKVLKGPNFSQPDLQSIMKQRDA